MLKVPRRLAVAACCLVLTVTTAAQSPGPTPVPLPPAIEQPRDVPYPAPLQLRVDATDVNRHLFHVHETIPVTGATPLVLLYPQWIPGSHSPTGRVDFFGGLVIRSGNARVEWSRDPVDVFAFHVRPPAGASRLDVDFDFVSPLEPGQGRVVMTPEVVNLQWNQVVLYPAGYFARQIIVEPTVKLPDDWQASTALEKRSSAAGNVITFRSVSLETLLDSPIFAGKYAKSFELDPSTDAPVRMNLFADSPELIVPTDNELAAHRALVAEAYALFGSRHFRHYDLLVALTSRLGGIGLEHLESSENTVGPSYFTDWLRRVDERNTIPHELVHSWNGKFRRPADLWTANFNVPMRGSLLWVYEGQTQYWGTVLEGRSGLAAREQILDLLAVTAAAYDHRVGREWRTLEDTTNDPVATLRRPKPWVTWLRQEDYYYEGELLWLDADTLIRELSHGRRSLDDFAKAFFGVADKSMVPLTYQFDDVVRALNDVQPYDWAGFLRTRLESHGPGAPLDGIVRGGYTLVYRDTPSDYVRNLDTIRNVTTLAYSLGITVTADGRISDVLWDSPAFEAGLVPGQQITAIRGEAFTATRIRDAITDAHAGSNPIELLVKNGDAFRTVTIDYRGGLRYPYLERDRSKPALLDDILAPKRRAN
jgi:predicted metalloprotease with PDZ domain